MSIDIEKLSPKELTHLISQASQRKKQLQKRKPSAGVRRQIIALARKAGYTVAELFDGVAAAGTEKHAKPAKPTKSSKRKGRKSATSGMKVAPKFRNPANPLETWAGRGKQPKWLAAEIAKGKVLEDFAIR